MRSPRLTRALASIASAAALLAGAAFAQTAALPSAAPESVGLSSERLARIDRVMQRSRGRGAGGRDGHAGCPPRPDRAPESARLGRPRAGPPDDDGHRLPAGVDDQAVHHRRRDDADGRRPAPGHRSGVEVHPGVQHTKVSVPPPPGSPAGTPYGVVPARRDHHPRPAHAHRRHRLHRRGGVGRLQGGPRVHVVITPTRTRRSLDRRAARHAPVRGAARRAVAQRVRDRHARLRRGEGLGDAARRLPAAPHLRAAEDARFLLLPGTGQGLAPGGGLFVEGGRHHRARARRRDGAGQLRERPAEGGSPAARARCQRRWTMRASPRCC